MASPAEVINTRDFLIRFFRDEDPNISVAGAERIVDHLIRQNWLGPSAYDRLGSPAEGDEVDADQE